MWYALNAIWNVCIWLWGLTASPECNLLSLAFGSKYVFFPRKQQDFCKNKSLHQCTDTKFHSTQPLAKGLVLHAQINISPLRTLMVQYTGEVRLTVKTRTHGSLHGTHSFWLHEVIWEPVNPCYSLPLQGSLVQNEEVWLHSCYNVRDQISTWLLSHETNSWGNLPS